MFCNKCGSEIADGSKFCSSCGQPVSSTSTGDSVRFEKVYNDSSSDNYTYANNNLNHYNQLDEPNTVLNVLSFFFPIIGLIFYIIFRGNEPIKARAIGKWAIIGVITKVGLSCLYNCIVVGLTSLM